MQFSWSFFALIVEDIELQPRNISKKADVIVLKKKNVNCAAIQSNERSILKGFATPLYPPFQTLKRRST